VAKGNRGLPSSFKIDIPDRPEPVELGDYLEEVDPAPPPVARPKPTPPAPEGEPRSEKVVEFPKPALQQKEAPAAEFEDAEERPRRRRKRIPKPPPRKQINTTPETQRMIGELIDFVQTYSVQKDVKASEVFHGLVLALYESLEYLDLSTVPARGRWGTPTAQAFPISLKSAFKAAIAQSLKKNHR
jgi:hypothetical protein